MAAIARIDTFIVDVPTIRPHVLAMTTMHAQSMVIVRLSDGDGVEGIGEGTTIGGLSYGDESPESIKSAIDTYIAPVLRTCDVAQVGATMAAIGKSVRGNHFAKCAIETALLDMAGKRLGVPVSELLGGGRVRSTLPVAWTLASGDTARDIEEGEKVLAERRHRIFKIKIGKRAVVDDVATWAPYARPSLAVRACASTSTRTGPKRRPTLAWACFMMPVSIWLNSPSHAMRSERWRGSLPDTRYR